jgi:hypothetical protein
MDTLPISSVSSRADGAEGLVRSVLPERYLAAGQAISKAHNVRVWLLIVLFFPQ